MAAAPLEDRFWANFCELIGLAVGLRDDQRDPKATCAAMAELIGVRTAADREARFRHADVCSTIVRTAREAAEDPAFAARGLFSSWTGDGAGATMPALVVPIDPGIAARTPTARRRRYWRPAGAALTTSPARSARGSPRDRRLGLRFGPRRRSYLADMGPTSSRSSGPNAAMFGAGRCAISSGPSRHGSSRPTATSGRVRRPVDLVGARCSCASSSRRRVHENLVPAS